MQGAMKTFAVDETSALMALVLMPSLHVVVLFYTVSVFPLFVIPHRL
jgi:hypothetical protein